MNSVRDLPKEGLPHSDICGSTIARISPQLFAACHVLHRLLAPRHPPNALISLAIQPQPPARRTKPRPRAKQPKQTASLTQKSHTTKLLQPIPDSPVIEQPARSGPEGSAPQGGFGSTRPGLGQGNTPKTAWSIGKADRLSPLGNRVPHLDAGTWRRTDSNR
jgi:hypothetical protein